jgi:predicted dehydrogenase
MTRRSVLSTGAGGYAARRSFMLGASTAAASAQVAGTADRLRIGIIGAGWRGQLLMKYVNEVGAADWVAVTDLYSARRDEAETIAGKRLEKFTDYRRMLDRKDVDVVIISAPDHWHATMLIDALRAGKDVFCEKPMAATPAEGLSVLRVAREAKRIVQTGTQQRSLPVIREAKEKFIDTGLLGTVTMVYAYWNENAGYLLSEESAALAAQMKKKPDNLDWNAWLGPLPKVPWNPLRFLRPYLFWGSSTIAGNILIHYLDVIHWYLNLQKPSWATSMGGLYHLRDGRDVPDTYSTSLEYPEGVMVTYTSCFAEKTGRRQPNDLIFMGTGGRLQVFRQGYRFVPADTRAGAVTAAGRDGSYHIRNWLECVRSRRQPNCGVVDAHYLAAACYISTEAFFQKRPVYWQDSWDVEIA